jgi:hypothetical protein
MIDGNVAGEEEGEKPVRWMLVGFFLSTGEGHSRFLFAKESDGRAGANSCRYSCCCCCYRWWYGLCEFTDTQIKRYTTQNT